MNSTSTRKAFVDYFVEGAAYGTFAGSISSLVFLCGLSLPSLLKGHLEGSGVILIGVFGSMIIGAVAGAVIGSVFYFKFRQSNLSNLRGAFVGLLAAGLPAIPFIIDTAGREIANGGKGGTAPYMWSGIWIFYLLSAIWVGTRFSGKVAKQD